MKSLRKALGLFLTFVFMMGLFAVPAAATGTLTLSSSYMLIPPAGQTATVQASVERATGVTYSLDQAYTGVSINETTGLITIDSTANGKAYGADTKVMPYVEVQAQVGSETLKAPLALSDCDVINGGVLEIAKAELKDGYYVQKDSNLSIQKRYCYYEYNDSKIWATGFGPFGRYVFDGVVRLSSGKNSATLRVNPWDGDIITLDKSVCGAEDFNLRVVFDHTKKTMDYFVNGILAGTVEIKNGATKTELDLIYAYDLDLKSGMFWQAPATATPEIYNLKLNEPTVGSNLSVEYDYFSLSGAAESGTEVKYLLTETSEATTGTEVTSVTSSDVGKYITAVVTPKDAKGNSGTTYRSTPTQVSATLTLSDDYVLVPPSGQTATLQASVQGVSGVTYSLDKTYTGITIDGQTGLITVDSTVESGTQVTIPSVTVNATVNSSTLSKSFDIVKYDFASDIGAIITDAAESDDWYVQNSDRVSVKANYCRYVEGGSGRFYNPCGRWIFDGTVKLLDATKDAYFVPTVWADQIKLPYYVCGEGEFRLRVVSDLNTHEMTWFINDELVGSMRNTAQTKLGTSEQHNIILQNLKLKNDGLVWSAPKTAAPKAYNVSLASTRIGKALTASYEYFSLSGVKEDATKAEIRYIISDSATLTGSETEHTSYTLTKEDIGKYVTAQVTVADENGTKGEKSYSTPLKIESQLPYEIRAFMNGENTAELEQNGTITGVKIFGNYTSEESATAYVAIYDGQTLAKLATVSVTGITADEEKTVSFAEPLTIPQTTGTCTVKAMIFSDGLQPLAPVLLRYGYSPVAQQNLFLISDSLCQTYGENMYPMQGWGYYLGELFSDKLTVKNFGHSGWSTETFMSSTEDTEYKWENIKTQIQPGDYVLVGLGINDASTTGTYRTTESKYMENLKQFIDETREKGGEVILQTLAIQGKNENSTEPWTYDDNDIYARRSELVKKVAEEKGVVCLDHRSNLVSLYNNMAKTYIDAGKSEQEAYNLVRYTFHLYASNLKSDEWTNVSDSFISAINNNDTMHYNQKGAEKMAEIIAQEIKNSTTPLAQYVSLKKS